MAGESAENAYDAFTAAFEQFAEQQQLPDANEPDNERAINNNQNEPIDEDKTH